MSTLQNMDHVPSSDTGITVNHDACLQLTNTKITLHANMFLNGAILRVFYMWVPWGRLFLQAFSLSSQHHRLAAPPSTAQTQQSKRHAPKLSCSPVWRH